MDTKVGRYFGIEHQMYVQSIFMLGAITIEIIRKSIKYLRKHDLLFEVESNYYRRKKLKDLVNFTFKE